MKRPTLALTGVLALALTAGVFLGNLFGPTPAEASNNLYGVGGPVNTVLDTATSVEKASAALTGSICQVAITVRETSTDTDGIELAFASGGAHIIVPTDGMYLLPAGANVNGLVLYVTDPDGGGDTDAVVTTWNCS